MMRTERLKKRNAGYELQKFMHAYYGQGLEEGMVVSIYVPLRSETVEGGVLTTGVMSLNLERLWKLRGNHVNVT